MEFRCLCLIKVCISSMFFNNQQVFVGPNNDIPNFSMDGDGLICNDDNVKSSWLTIKNGEVVFAKCKGLIYISLIFVVNFF